jgi:ureidoacrylate peracid hydrolase
VPFSFDPATTAVVVVDTQNDFATPGGMFDRAGIDITTIRAIVPNVGALLEAARSCGVAVTFTMAKEQGLSLTGPDEPTVVRAFRGARTTRAASIHASLRELAGVKNPASNG